MIGKVPTRLLYFAVDIMPTFQPSGALYRLTGYPAYIKCVERHLGFVLGCAKIQFCILSHCHLTLPPLIRLSDSTGVFKTITQV